MKSRLLPLLVLLPILTACGGGGEPENQGPRVRLEIVSGSENKGLEPVIREFAQKRGVDIEMHYLGSVDIALELEKAEAIPYDAVWPANSLWIALGDRTRIVKHSESIMRSPVVFAVKRSVAEGLGWVGREDVNIQDILEAAEAGRLRFAMTSATQSNSGASAYLGFLSAMAGSPEVLTAEHLGDAEVRQKVRRLLAAVDRSSGSSGWLVDMFLKRYARFDAMVNYEALVIEANRELIARGDEPLYAVYPQDGMTIADSPLGYVDHGDAAKEALFLELQEYLLSSEVQSRIGSLGRRTGLLGLDASSVDPAVFNPEWGIDVSRVISPVPVPEEAVIREALDLYQVALRKPSLTAYVLDFSGSMEGSGEEQLKDAMATLLDPNQARRFLLQPSAEDIHIVVPFDGKPRGLWEAVGNDPETLRLLLNRILSSDSGGGTDMYAATTAALEVIDGKYGDRLAGYFPAVIVMSDGRSKGSLGEVRRQLERSVLGYDLPIFTIAFGDAEDHQLEELSELTSARLFDGREDLIQAFRKAKGYN
jgi:Ca-activated chloride channel family protein